MTNMTLLQKSTLIREQIWSKLHAVAKPDSRFDLDFAEVIPDFEGSERATDRVVALEAYQNSQFSFITPDNCLADLRRRMIEQGKTFIMSTYGIYRGFVLIRPGMVPDGAALYASWLDGMEYFAKPVSLAEIAEIGKLDFMVTGASAVSAEGIRFGKGHGFFDIEWGMFTDLGLSDESTPVVAVVHDCQLVQEKLNPNATDIIVDYIATPETLHNAHRQLQRPRGIKWELLDQQQIDSTPPLQELQRMQGLA